MTRPVPIIPHLIDRHAGDAGFYWAQITDSAHSPVVDLDGLADLERLLDAHLDGLRAAGDAGWEAALAAWQRWGTAEEMYVCARLALESDRARERMRTLWPSDPARMQRVLPGLVGALAHTGALDWIQCRLGADSPLPAQEAAWRALARLARMGTDVGAVAAHAMPAALRAAAAPIRRAALGAAVRIGWLELARPALGDPDPDVRAEAAIDLVTQSPAAAAVVLREVIAAALAGLAELSGTPHREAAEGLTRWVRYLALAADPAAPTDERPPLPMPVRIGLEYALQRGAPALLPWVVAQMHDPEAARLAGWVWSSLTGIDLEQHGLTLEPREPDPDHEPPPTDELDSGLPLPDPAAVSACRLGSLGADPILLGAPLRGEHALNILRRASQALRWIAARRHCGTGFDVCAPAARQRVLLEGCEGKGLGRGGGHRGRGQFLLYPGKSN